MLILSLKIDKQSFLSFWTDGSVMGWASTEHSVTTLYTLNSSQLTVHITHYTTQYTVMGWAITTDCTTDYTLDTGKWTLLSYGLGQPVSEGRAHLCTLHSARLYPDEHCAQCSPVHSAHMCTLSISAQCLSSRSKWVGESDY